MFWKSCLSAGVALVVLCMSPPALAQDATNLKAACLTEDAPAQAAVEACTALLADENISDNDLLNARYARGLAQTRLGNLNGALRDYDQVISQYDRNPDLFLERAKLLGRLRRIDDALSDFDKAMEIVPRRTVRFEGGGQGFDWDMPKIEILLERSQVLAKAGRHAEAVASLSDALARLPESMIYRLSPDPGLLSMLHAKRGESAWKSGSITEAMTDAEAAIAADPEGVPGFRLRAELRAAAGDDAGARADFEHAIGLDPANSTMVIFLADWLVEKGEALAAVRVVDRASKSAPDDAAIANGMCWYRAVANVELDIAARECDRALDLLPGRSDIFDSRAMVHLRSQRWQQAYDDYASAVKANNSNPAHLYGRGIAAMRLGRDSEGKADMAAAVAADPEVVAQFHALGF